MRVRTKSPKKLRASPPRMTKSQARQAKRELKQRSRSEMPIGNHLRELRARVLRSVLAIIVGTIIGWIYYEQIFDLLAQPINHVVEQARADGRDVQLVMTGVAQAFTLKLQIASMAGVIIASPVWIYQLWRFVTPGLRPQERRWSMIFVVIAVPLFLLGVVLSYLVLPRALEVLFEFTPNGVANYLGIDTYLSFFTRVVMIFGVGFLSPLLIIGLNIFGVLTGKTLLSWWRVIIFAVFVFAAIATPTGDPVTMLQLALPILILVGIALGFCFLNDRRRARNSNEPDYDQWSDDELSPID